MASSTPLDGDMFVEDGYWLRTKMLSSPKSDGDMYFGNGVFENFSSQHSRTLDDRTGGSSSHGDGPHGDELIGSEISGEALSVLGENKTAEQDEPDLLPADFGTLDDRQKLQEGEDKPTGDSPEPFASEQVSPPGGDWEDGTDVTKKSTTDKSYVPSSAFGSAAPAGKRKLASSMSGPSKINTRSRTRLGVMGDDGFAPANPTQGESVQADGAEDSKKKKPAASHKRVAKKPFGSGETGLKPDTVHQKPPTKVGVSRVRRSKPESPGTPSSTSSNRQQHTARKNVASSATTLKASDMSIYEIEGSPESETPALRKTAAKGRSRKRTAPAPDLATTGQMQPAKKARNRKFQAPVGPKSQENSQGNKQRKPLQTYGRAAAEEVGDGSSHEKTTIPNSKRRRSHTGQETTDHPLKKSKVQDDTNVSPVPDEEASSAPGKMHTISSDDGGVAEHEGTFNLRPDPSLPRTQFQAVSPVQFGMGAKDESTQKLTMYGAIQWPSAKGLRPLKPAASSGQKQHDVPRSIADLGDKRAPLPLQVVPHLPKSHHHSSILKVTSTKPMSMTAESENHPRIEQNIRDLDLSNRFTPLFRGQNEQYVEVLPASTAGQRDDRRSSPYSLHPRSRAFQQKLSSMQAAREKEQSVFNETDRIQSHVEKDQHSSRTEAYGDPLKRKNRWQAAVDETSQGLADAMHSITNTVLRELMSKEETIESIVKEYSRNGAMIAANSFRRQQEEYERAVLQFEPICNNLSQAFSCATEETMEMQTELSSKIGRLRQLVAKRRGNHRESMATDSAKSASQNVF